MLAGASRFTPSRVSHDLSGCSSSQAGPSFHSQDHATVDMMWHRIQTWEAHLWVRVAGWISRRPRAMHGRELVAVSCPECRCSPVEVLRTLHSGRRFLWCPHCRAIWAVDTWVLNRPASLIEPTPKVIAFGPSSGRRPF